MRQVRPHAVNVLVATCALAAAARIFWMIDRHAVNVLFWDQFSFYQALTRDASAWELFRWQHGPHRQGIPFLLTAALSRATDWNTRADAFLIGGAVCGAAALALWLRRRLLGPFCAADAAIPLLILTPAQYGIFLHTPNLSHGAGPLVLLLSFCLAFTVRRRAHRYAALAALDFLLIHTGFGVVAGALAPPLFLLAALRDARAYGAQGAVLPLAGAALSLASIAIFAIGYDTHDLDQVAAARPPLTSYGLYVALMFANVLGLKGAGTAAVLGGALALVAALAVAAEQVVRLMRSQPLRSPAAAHQLAIATLTSFSLAFAAATAYGRIALGLPGAQSTRYVPLLVPAFLGIYLRIAAIGRPRLRGALLAVSAAVIVLAVVPMRSSEVRFMERLASGKRAWVEAYLATENLAQANERAGLPIFPHETPAIPRMLAYLREHRLNFYADQ